MDNKKSMLVVIRKKFNEILSRHIIKLLDTYYEIFDLSFNLPELSCLILIQEKIAGQSDNFPLCIKNYSKEKLFDEVSELGLQTGPELDTSFEQLIQKKYISIDEDKNICVNKLTYSITKLLARIYPNMCGMNLLAYIIQTMDEAISGRKDLAIALDQFDQTMQMHGVILKKQESKQAQKKAVNSVFSSKNLQNNKAETYSRNQHVPDRKEHGIRGSSSIIKSGNVIKSFDSPFSETKNTPVFEEEKEIIDKNELNAPDDKLLECSNKEKPFDSDSENDASQQSSLNKLLKNIENKITADIHSDAIKKDILPGSDGKECEDSRKNDSVDEDDIVENRIAAFEEELAMQCPICNQGKVLSNKTPKNKIYFRCSNKQCSFISWGKPFYISCPRCNNNFLIEHIQNDGQNVLRCPRATCHYTQPVPGETMSESQKNTALIDKSVQTGDIPHLPVKRAARKRVVRRRK